MKQSSTPTKDCQALPGQKGVKCLAGIVAPQTNTILLYSDVLFYQTHPPIHTNRGFTTDQLRIGKTYHPLP